MVRKAGRNLGLGKVHKMDNVVTLGNVGAQVRVRLVSKTGNFEQCAYIVRQLQFAGATRLAQVAHSLGINLNSAHCPKGPRGLAWLICLHQWPTAAQGKYLFDHSSGVA